MNMFQQRAIAENLFLTNVSALQEQVRVVLEYGEVCTSPETSLALLQSVLATEILCIRRYTAIAVSEDGLRNPWIGAEFQEQANDERRHMELVAERILHLGGVPDYRLDAATSAPAGEQEMGSFAKCVSDNLAAEQCVIAQYKTLQAYFLKHDPASSMILEEIIRDEEDHTSDMEDLLASYG
jgi:bacterioferritin